MFRGNNSNTAAPPLLDNHFLYPADMSNQLQPCSNLPAEFHVNPVNYIGNNHGTPFLLPNKCVGDDEAITRQQKLQISLNNRTFPDEADRKVSILNQNPVSTGLRLSYDEDERNSSITSASGSLKDASSVFSSLSNDTRRELDQQKQELDQFIKSQEETMMKGVRDIRQRHMASLLTALEKGVVRKLHEKDLELQTVTRKNKELVESVKQVTNEAQNWCYMAKCNESVINILKTNLQQAMQNSNRGKEGLGESNVDDAASCIDPNNYLGVAGGSGRSASVKKDMMCKSCKEKQVSILLMPCRHLCLCKECEGFVSVCPVCQMIATASFEVYLS
ncbi:probable BOI-related E3 ubiquitin-protein ligase 2 [Sesamum indicum]|uniref:Probable BOI-related E3 ubiquitin-protein ligase 2 n=1 Tax=Sesamum indicum TaxID=4182 RepID=A0A6I9TPP1_SESIN|nr:probable BOI-related E3 ubiquitin-protein ligase 2 [Sesamum indicum]XP_011086588.1 probable BOI-related E3 ubiquitin-protein ligase 2 [Sesamum indicum]XP_020551895.1 probable BOI-related E3 ubiquitin-protein ligase 2 [Sesamum indicum]XP_020551896.1 probable BOI-related E3 ubiquitin-protein ligase 2 [Sesamum indicum]